MLVPAVDIVVSARFDPTLILWLNLAGTFVVGLSGAVAGVRARLDLVGVVALAAVVALAGGIIRDLLIGVPPATFRDLRYLAAAGAAGLIGFAARPALDRAQRSILLFDAMGLSVFCVAGVSKAIDFGLGPVQATILGAVTAIGGGLVRDVLLGEVPSVLRHELYAIPALLGAAIIAAAHEAGSSSGLFAISAPRCASRSASPACASGSTSRSRRASAGRRLFDSVIPPPRRVGRTACK